MQSACPGRGRTPSPLEALPVEIIQAIFLHSLEFNLPRATIYLTRALSDPIIYTWLIRLACTSPNPSARCNFFTPDYLPPPLDPFALTAAQRGRLQSAIYSCGWCTLSLIRQCQRQHVAHGIKRKCAAFTFSPEDKIILSNLDHEFNKAYAAKNGRGGKGDLILKARSPAGGGDRRLALWLDAGAFQIRPQRSYYIIEHDVFRLPAFNHNAPARVPDRLLCAPWSEEKLELLRLLAAEAYVDEDDEHARSSRVLGKVIRARDFRTFLNLVDMRVATRVEWQFRRWPVLLCHFKLALKYAQGKEDPFVKYLVDKRWDEIPDKESQLKLALMTRLRVGKMD